MHIQYLLISALVVTLSSGCGQMAKNICASEDLPDGIWVCDDPIFVEVKFSEGVEYIDGGSGFRLCLFKESENQTTIPIFCYLRGKAGGGREQRDIWPIIYTISSNKDSIVLLPPDYSSGDYFLALNPISDAGRSTWYRLDLDANKIEKLNNRKMVMPTLDNASLIADGYAKDTFLELIEKAQAYRSKLRQS